ncbi:hypothetical protein BU26DRAFT_507602 [Trematosphaeria pertusa]|uniref:Uncharacterized protein n=1 Tax=Trematosphaeria pertusa TaxID=390896 RepID=A0A6A6I6I1_9PLEO|nr:uncharacterized protein BU26DRAFT_507602 [Trematosphaeria pertusa]KAF2245936.1 hypothetical protein BU26DRAFT_507602 [Trematosphaeria pertusa]
MSIYMDYVPGLTPACEIPHPVPIRILHSYSSVRMHRLYQDIKNCLLLGCYGLNSPYSMERTQGRIRQLTGLGPPLRMPSVATLPPVVSYVDVPVGGPVGYVPVRGRNYGRQPERENSSSSDSGSERRRSPRRITVDGGRNRRIEDRRRSSRSNERDSSDGDRRRRRGDRRSAPSRSRSRSRDHGHRHSRRHHSASRSRSQSEERSHHRSTRDRSHGRSRSHSR